MGNCYNKVEIARPPISVWQTIHDFHDMSWAGDVITSLEKVGEKNGTEIGAKRILNGIFYETLQAYDPYELTFSYSIDDGPGPVARSLVKNYTGTVNVSATEGGTVVEWNSTFESEDDDEVGEFRDPIYAALLAALHDTLTQTE